MESNNPVYESIFLEDSKQSILVYEIEKAKFAPFWHYHPEIELTLVTKGNGIRIVGDNIESFQEGDLVLIGENLPHHWVSKEITSSNTQKAIVTQFQMKIFEKIGELSSIRHFLSSAQVGLHFPKVESTVLKSIEDLLHVAPSLRVSLLIQILYNLAQNSTSRSLSQSTKFNILDSSKEQERINKVIAFIIENLNKKLTVNLMADKCCMIPQAFCRWFRKHTGMSFITYLNKSRIESACQYLLTTDMPAKFVAYEVGFENASHFHRTFKKYVGVSPLEYRKRHLA